MAMRLIFLPGGGYFFDSGIKTYWTTHLDPLIANLLQGKAGESQIDKLWDIAIAPQSAFLCYQNQDGRTFIHHKLPVHPKLARWIDHDGPHIAEQCHISLGSNGQFFARSNKGYQWAGVPCQFTRHIQMMRTEGGDFKEGHTPNGAHFGINDTYLITCFGGKHFARSSELEQNYPGLVKELLKCSGTKGTTRRVYEYVTLNPYARDEWVIVWADDSISWNMPSSFSQMAGAVSEWLSNRLMSNDALYASPETPLQRTQAKLEQPPASVKDLATPSALSPGSLHKTYQANSGIPLTRAMYPKSYPKETLERSSTSNRPPFSDSNPPPALPSLPSLSSLKRNSSPVLSKYHKDPNSSSARAARRPPFSHQNPPPIRPPFSSIHHSSSSISNHHKTNNSSPVALARPTAAVSMGGAATAPWTSSQETPDTQTPPLLPETQISSSAMEKPSIGSGDTVLNSGVFGHDLSNYMTNAVFTGSGVSSGASMGGFQNVYSAGGGGGSAGINTSLQILNSTMKAANGIGNITGTGGPVNATVTGMSAMGLSPGSLALQTGCCVM